ncbi:hypothetical protein CYMTET_18775 [Cymbomonas tetramitiformis]|uniref:BSD domain-containing protein n=1 Tax=Cymbomonas tetramitiformis TaxID=36881 RepID=A0AAE0L5X4_9CHLO|nr:hypothetical protein CYMTET_18775 [Cymbomonas tetramitiformis]
MGAQESKNPDIVLQPWPIMVHLCLKELSLLMPTDHICADYGPLEKIAEMCCQDEKSLGRRRDNAVVALTVDPTSDTLHMELFEDLMQRYPAVGTARMKFVPGRLSEAQFWSNLFDYLKVEVLRLYMKHPLSAPYTYIALQALEKVAWDARQLDP